MALFLVGSFYDLQISEALVNPANPVGIFGAAYGEYPLALALLVGGLILVLFRNTQKTGLMVTQIVLGSVAILGSVAFLVVNPIRFIDGAQAVVIGIDVLLVAAVIWITFRSLRGVNRELAVRVAIVLLVISLGELLIVNILKIGWERPRMRMLMEVPDATFAPWWSPGTPEKGLLVASGVAPEEFKSFPSGHTANATVLIASTALATLKRGWEKALPWLFWGGVVWGFYVGFSRIIMGAHFLTDTVVGFTVTFLCTLVVYRFAFPRGAGSALAPDTEPGDL